MEVSSKLDNRFSYILFLPIELENEEILRRIEHKINLISQCSNRDKSIKSYTLKNSALHQTFWT